MVTKKCRGLGLWENETICKLLGLCLGLQVRLKMFVTLTPPRKEQKQRLWWPRCSDCFSSINYSHLWIHWFPRPDVGGDTVFVVVAQPRFDKSSLDNKPAVKQQEFFSSYKLPSHALRYRVSRSHVKTTIVFATKWWCTTLWVKESPSLLLRKESPSLPDVNPISSVS